VIEERQSSHDSLWSAQTVFTRFLHDLHTLEEPHQVPARTEFTHMITAAGL